METYRIRHATPQDLEVVMYHRRRMFEEMGFTDPRELNAMLASSTSLFRLGLASGHYRGWLVEAPGEGVVAGGGAIMLEFHSHPREPLPRRAWVVNLFTEPGHRRRGLARKLMETVLEWCRAEGMVSLYLHASDDGRPLYESLGFKPTSEMRIGLSSAGLGSRRLHDQERGSMDRLEAHRTFFAHLVTASAGVPATERRLIEAFGSTPRERFVGSGPWRVFTRAGYIETPSDDPALLYQDITVALKSEAQINNGQPTLHAICLASLGLQEGEAVAHVGAGTGYYSALLARLTGPTGSVIAYEIDQELAERAAENLAEYPNVRIEPRSGTEGPLPACDVVYVNAGATHPAPGWLDALKPGGRLLFPLTPDQGAGAMLLVTRTMNDTYAARFVCGAMFIPCIGARDREAARTLSEAMRRGDMGSVSSLRRDGPPDSSCWCAGRGWWLSTSIVE